MRDRIHFTTLKPILAGALLLGTGALAHGHHSFAGFDKSRVLVLTGMVTSYKPHPNHAEFAFVPLNPDHTGLQQDAQGNPLAWQVELEYGAALAARDDRITDGTFRKGDTGERRAPSDDERRPQGGSSRPHHPLSRQQATAARQALRFGGWPRGARRGPAGHTAIAHPS